MYIHTHMYIYIFQYVYMYILQYVYYICILPIGSPKTSLDHFVMYMSGTEPFLVDHKAEPGGEPRFQGGVHTHGRKEPANRAPLDIRYTYSLNNKELKALPQYHLCSPPFRIPTTDDLRTCRTWSKVP